METTTNHYCLTTWRRRAERAQARGYFTEHEETLAANWCQCAVGEAFKRYPKLVDSSFTSFNEWLSPSDPLLSNLGGDFSEVVWCLRDPARVLEDGAKSPTNRTSAFKKVFKILDKIESRLNALANARARVKKPTAK